MFIHSRQIPLATQPKYGTSALVPPGVQQINKPVFSNLYSPSRLNWVFLFPMIFRRNIRHIPLAVFIKIALLSQQTKFGVLLIEL
jgi:hypothetical protein